MYLVKSQYSVGKINGVNKIIAEIYADTEADLPDYDKCKGVDGELFLGSLCYAVQDAEMYALNSNGVWYQTSEAKAVTNNADASLLSKQGLFSAPKFNLNKAEEEG